jgi:Holliday junction DNA helicase RuvA
MIALLSGNFLHKTPTRVVVDAGGVGYEVHISLNTYSAIANLKAGSLFTHLKIAEDAFTLYGFWEEAEKDIFLKVIGVSGVGAGTARMMLNSLKPQELAQAIAQSNIKALESIKGIGKKTAERIVLELKDKMSLLAAPSANFGSMNTTTETDALNALLSLGIAKPAAEAALKKAQFGSAANAPVELLVKQALKNL